MSAVLSTVAATSAQAKSTVTSETNMSNKSNKELGYNPVHTPNGWTLPYTEKDGVKEFHLIAEEIEHEFAPGSTAKCWGYNGTTPGPTLEA
ncbi:MAG: copper oxidase, partial [Pseudomonadales bacterium]|nr:copper oxidase [Pseudomonadales bacterium]